MRLFLIRHAETVDNAASVYAGTRDSALTSHGVIQTRRLGAHLAKVVPTPKTRIFASDLQRAVKTAEAIRDARGEGGEGGDDVEQLPDLREKFFGTGEGQKFGAREPHDGAETTEEMQVRADRFLADHLLGLCTEDAVFVVSHGLMLNVILRRLCEKLPSGSVSVSPEAQHHANPSGTAVLARASWSNTGYLEMTLSGGQPQWSALKARIEVVNSTGHLQGLRKTRGGIGSARFDSNQKTMDSFFKPAPKKRKLADAAE